MVKLHGKSGEIGTSVDFQVVSTHSKPEKNHPIFPPSFFLGPPSLVLNNGLVTVIWLGGLVKHENGENSDRVTWIKPIK